MSCLTISQAIEGFLLEKKALRVSAETIDGYNYAFGKFLSFLGDENTDLSSITTGQIKQFLAQVGNTGLSKTTCSTIHAYLSSLWTWAITEGYVTHHIIRAVPAPNPEERAINPFTESDVRALLAACERSRPYSRPGKISCDNKRPTALRDRAVILLLLDTGIRASELCNLSVGDVDIKNRKVKVFGKGSKERMLSISASTAKSIWHYTTNCRTGESSDAPLFVTAHGQRMRRNGLHKLIRNIGGRAGISDAHPHRFRHTFAINFLRNGANVYALQMALGHTTLQMVKRYLALVQADLEVAHKQASPVANWRL